MTVDGLTAAEAKRILATSGPNELPTTKQRTLPRLAWDVIREPMLLLLLAAGSVNFLLAEPADGALLMSFVIVVIGISIFEKRKSENALAALRDLSAPRALVIRDGEQIRVAGRDVVPGDVVMLSEGDRVPADAVLVSSTNVSVDESAMTGESVPVRKSVFVGEANARQMGPPGGDGTPWVFSGTLVVKGQGTAVVQGTGVNTELGRIGVALQSIEPERTRMQREVDRLVRVMAAIGVVAATVVVLTYGLTRGGWLTGFLTGIGTAMAILPEEFPVVLTISLALGAWRMSQRNVLARRAPVIETLGSATVICVDKTGTLTMNSMTVSALCIDDDKHTIGSEELPDRFHEIAEFAVLASPLDPFDPMDKAFRALGELHLTGTEHMHTSWQLEREYPLSEELLALSHVWKDPNSSSYVIAAKGAPEAIGELCHLDAEHAEAVLRRVESATADGSRVLAIARANFERSADLPDEQHDFVFEYLGLASLQDPVRPGVAAAVAECASAGIRTVMITGDYPGTALAVAREIGIDHDAGAITGPELAAMSDEQLNERIRTVSVFARMVPEQKLQLIRALKANGEVVAMTGDGVNDAPALRAADIGIAMGARGTDVAREAAAIVITDDDFGSIATSIRQGRGIYENLRKSMAYIIAVHVPIVGMSILPLVATDWPLVLLPLQIVFLQLIIDPACSIVFEAEPVDSSIMQQPPRSPTAAMFNRRVLTVSLLQGLGVFAAVGGIYVWAVSNHRPDQTIRSLTFCTLVVANLLLILVNRSWRLSVWQTMVQHRNPTLRWIMGGSITLLAILLTVPPVRKAFHLGVVRPIDIAISVVASLVAVSWFEIYKQTRA